MCVLRDSSNDIISVDQPSWEGPITPVRQRTLGYSMDSRKGGTASDLERPVSSCAGNG